MSKLQAFIKRALIGGLLVMLPIAVLFFFFHWLFQFVTNLLDPISTVLIKNYGLPVLAADLLTLLIILILCFIVGTIVSTSFGRWAHAFFEKHLERFAPGYRMVKEIVNQFLGEKSDSAFTKAQVARVKLFGPQVDTSVTALVTSQHKDGHFTVFIPTGPNPTSGLIYHLPAEQVELFPDIKVDSAMRTVIACGAGSDELFHHRDSIKPNQDQAIKE